MAMRVKIKAFDVWKLEVPLVRTVGDSNCHYDSLSVLAVCLRTDAGHSGWGYGECCSKGVFQKPAWYIQPMSALSVLKTAIEQQWWPRLEHRHPIEAWRGTRYHRSPYFFVNAALRMALWDLMAQEAELPLFQYL
jgi:L-alanine-DL-glutamate epimerase-like enolase superfamily enzyme